MDKRGELFVYFKEGGGANGPLSWREDGKRLYQVLQEADDKTIEGMYARMLVLQKESWYARLWRQLFD